VWILLANIWKLVFLSYHLVCVVQKGIYLIQSIATEEIDKSWLKIICKVEFLVVVQNIRFRIFPNLTKILFCFLTNLPNLLRSYDSFIFVFAFFFESHDLRVFYFVGKFSFSYNLMIFISSIVFSLYIKQWLDPLISFLLTWLLWLFGLMT